MKKKIFGVLVCSILILGVTGCNSSSSNKKIKNMTSENYGDKYNYSVTVNNVTIDDWKVFYKDDDGIYIITSEYLPIETFGNKDDENSLRSKANLKIVGDKYGMYFSTDNLKYQEPNQDIMNKYFKLLKLDSTDGSNKMISEMLHSENWDDLVNKDMGAAYAIGGVPIEMFVASWNEKYPNEKLYLSVEEKGYRIGTSENPTTYEVELNSMKGYDDKLYFPTKDIIEEGTHGSIDYKVTGYHLASPSWCQNSPYGKCSTTEILYESSGKIKGTLYGTYGSALRPIVFIPNK